MICNHLKKLYQLCEDNQLRLASSDLIRVVCRQCDEEETCPSMLMDQYDAQQEHKKTEQQKIDPSSVSDENLRVNHD